jgi:hypothetical protein
MHSLCKTKWRIFTKIQEEDDILNWNAEMVMFYSFLVCHNQKQNGGFNQNTEKRETLG